VLPRFTQYVAETRETLRQLALDAGMRLELRETAIAAQKGMGVEGQRNLIDIAGTNSVLPEIRCEALRSIDEVAFTAGDITNIRISYAGHDRASAFRNADRV
jgi:hypothetical protein